MSNPNCTRRRFTSARTFLITAAAAISPGLGGCNSDLKPSAAERTASPATTSATATQPAAGSHALSVKAPALTDTKPSDYPGLHNVVAFAPEVYSGSVPEGKEGFESLNKLGIKTILSVDGSEPEVDKAKAGGTRYVHLPINYSGFDESRRLEITKVVRDLPKPIYIHCHHGKHRSAGAAGSAVVSLGLLTPDDAVARMKVSGTSPDYKGLYACTVNSTKVMPAVLDAIKSDFPEVVRPKGTVKTMVEIDIAVEKLKEIQAAGWKSPPSHPDLVPAAEAGKLADYYRFLHEDKESKDRPAEYLQWMLAANEESAALEAALIKGSELPAAELDKRFAVVIKSCKTCHTMYRD